MAGNIEKSFCDQSKFVWEIKPRCPEKNKTPQDIHGVLLLDVDGTLTRPNSPYAIDSEAVATLSEFIDRGGVCVFNTGATQGRIERTVLNPIFNNLDEKHNNTDTVSEIFKKHIICMPENGSAILLSTGVGIVENELYFNWHELHPLHVPDKEKLRSLLEKELAPSYQKSFVVGDRPGEANSRQYILSWKGLTNTLELVEKIKADFIPNHPEINWNNIGMKAARKTIDFIHSDSGKESSTAWLLNEIGLLSGPIIGFGDLGDEFGKIVPTINVNQGKPNEFRRRGIAAMELTKWESLDENGYVVINKDVRNKKTGTEINVLRDNKGNIIYDDKTSRPVEIKPVKSIETNQNIQDAGKGTSWTLNRLMSLGYFS